MEITCPDCKKTYRDEFAELFGAIAPCPVCEPYTPGTTVGETADQLADMECEHSIIREIIDCSCTGEDIWSCTCREYCPDCGAWLLPKRNNPKYESGCPDCGSKREYR